MRATRRSTLVAALAVMTIAALAAGITATAANAQAPRGAAPAYAGGAQPLRPPTSLEPPTFDPPTTLPTTSRAPATPTLTATMTRTVSTPSGIAVPGSTVTYRALIENTGTVRATGVYLGGWFADSGDGAANRVPCVSYVRDSVTMTPPWSTGAPPAPAAKTDGWNDDEVDLFFPSVSALIGLGVGATGSRDGYLDPGYRQLVTVTLEMAATPCSTPAEIGLHSFVNYDGRPDGGWFDSRFAAPVPTPVGFGGALAVPVGTPAEIVQTVRYPSSPGGTSGVTIDVAGPGGFVRHGSAEVSPASPAAQFTVTPPTVGRYAVTGTFAGDTYHLPAAATPATLTAYFHDYAPGGTFFDDIMWLAERGVARGDGVDFRPTDAVSRQAMAAFLYRMAHEGQDADACEGPSPFPDVAATSGFCGAIAWLASQGITQGDAHGRFDPTAAVSRQSMAAFLFRSVGPTEIPADCTGAPFSDVSGGAPFCAEIQWLIRRGVTEGYADGTYRPQAPVSRQAMAAFLHRLASS